MKTYWNIITGIWKKLETPNTNASDNIKKKHQKYIQSHIIAKIILVLNIDPSILINDYTINLAKQIWNTYTIQYKEKRFVLWFALFTYFVIRKMSLFKLIIVYNANFQITIDKISSSGENLFTNLLLAAYLHKIKVIYSDFIATQKFSAKTKIFELPTIIVELEDKERQAKVVELIALPIWSKKMIKKRQSQMLIQGKYTKNNISILRSKGNKDKYAYYDIINHSKNSY